MYSGILFFFFFFKIFDGADDSSTVIGQYCGTNIPSYIPSSGSSLLLKFKSNGSVQRSGFAIAYRVDDSGQGGGGGGGTETNGKQTGLQGVTPEDPISSNTITIEVHYLLLYMKLVTLIALYWQTQN